MLVWKLGLRLLAASLAGKGWETGWMKVVAPLIPESGRANANRTGRMKKKNYLEQGVPAVLFFGGLIRSLAWGEWKNEFVNEEIDIDDEGAQERGTIACATTLSTYRRWISSLTNSFFHSPHARLRMKIGRAHV